jgi:hypothetical protein
MTQVKLFALEPLCDLRIVHAKYGSLDESLTSRHIFRIQFTSSKQSTSVDVREEEGDVFAAELEALANIIRSRVDRARLIGEETTSKSAKSASI